MDVAKDFATGVELYFNQTLPRMLLYSFERLQYRDSLSRYKGQDPSEVGSAIFSFGALYLYMALQWLLQTMMNLTIFDCGAWQLYGAEHLLRMFVRLPDLVALARIPEESKVISRLLNEIRLTFTRHGRWSGL